MEIDFWTRAVCLEMGENPFTPDSHSISTGHPEVVVDTVQVGRF